jgi:hypothetical protein
MGKGCWGNTGGKTMTEKIESIESAYEKYHAILDNFDQSMNLLDAQEMVQQAREDAEEVRSLMDKRDWDGFCEKGLRMKNLGDHRIRNLLNGQEKLNQIRVAAQYLAKAEPRTSSEPLELDQNDWKNIAAQLKEKMDGPLAGIISNTEGLLKDLNSGKVPVSEKPIDHLKDSRVTIFAEMHKEQRNTAIWYTISGYASMMNAKMYSIVDMAEPKYLSSEALNAIKREIQGVHDTGLDFLKKFYGKLIQESWSGLEDEAWKGASYPEEVFDDLMFLFQRLRRGHVFQMESKKRGHEKKTIDIARVEMMLHRSFRMMMLVLVASRYFLFIARQKGLHEEGGKEVKGALKMHFNSLNRDGVNVRIYNLLKSPKKYDGRFIETEGFIENLHLIHGKGGYGTKFNIVDIQHDHRLEVFLPFRDLVEWFVYDGAFMRVNGDFVASCSDSGGNPDLHLDRINLGENAKKSWFDYIAFKFDKTNIFELYPSQVNAMWSVESPPQEGGEA